MKTLFAHLAFAVALLAGGSGMLVLQSQEAAACNGAVHIRNSGGCAGGSC